MITKKEIKYFSVKFGIPPESIDKDWVLGHILGILYNNKYIKNHLVFKGGTCLKKCFFLIIDFPKT